MENHGMAASVVLAWQNCSLLQKAITANNAEKKILGMNTLLKPAEYTTLQQQFKAAHGKLVASELPGQTIIEQLDREIEEGEFTPFRLEELPSKEEVEQRYLTHLPVRSWCQDGIQGNGKVAPRFKQKQRGDGLM